MKKKILFALGAIAIAVVLTFNIGIAKSSNNMDLNLTLQNNTTLAYGEYPSGCDSIWTVTYTQSGTNVNCTCVTGGSYSCPIPGTC
jgi:hypothetical protein